jgi:hypothetical protein
MKWYKLFLASTLGVSLVLLTSCLKGDNSESYSNAYGYVVTSSGVKYAKVSAGYPVTWTGLQSYESGSCLRFSFTTDLTVSGDGYLAQNVTGITSITKYSLSNNTPIDVDADNVVSGIIPTAGAYDNWFGDNWFIAFATTKYPGKTVTPQFYYSTTIPEKFTGSTTDSVIVDVRLNVTGTATSTTKETETKEYAVNLSPLRALYSEDSRFKNKYIWVYFRYYATSTKPSYSKVYLYITN